MAILKHIASKNADYTAAFNYLVFSHDERTGKMLKDEQGYPIVRESYRIAGIRCLPETFAMECRKTNKKYKKNRKEEEIKSHHYIISFNPNDRSLGLTIDMAQELGMEFAKKNFPGHEVIVATHDDGSNHAGNIHIHIVLNSVRAVDIEKLPYDTRACDDKAGYKHNCTKAFLTYLEQEVASMCVKHGFHQVDFNSSKKRITNAEYQKVHREQKKLNKKNEEKQNQGEPVEEVTYLSEKEKLRMAIDDAAAHTLDEHSFKDYLQEKYQITVTENRGKWGYLSIDKKKTVRARRLGDDYEKEEILRRLEKNTEKWRRLGEQQKYVDQYLVEMPMPDCTKKVIYIEQRPQIQPGSRYERWAKIHNLQIQAEQAAFFTDNNVLLSDAVKKELERFSVILEDIHSEQKSINQELKSLNSQIRLLGQYYQLRKRWREYCSGGKQNSFYQQYREELDQYFETLQSVKKIYGNEKIPDIKMLKAEKNILLEKKEQLRVEEKELNRRKAQVKVFMQNRKYLLRRNIDLIE